MKSQTNEQSNRDALLMSKALQIKIGFVENATISLKAEKYL